jgi:hypothetical protein
MYLMRALFLHDHDSAFSKRHSENIQTFGKWYVVNDTFDRGM